MTPLVLQNTKTGYFSKLVDFKTSPRLPPAPSCLFGSTHA